MRRKLATILVLVFVFSVSFSAIAVANEQTRQIRLYDADGNEVFGGRVLYNENKTPVFCQGCWFYAANGDRVSAFGKHAFRYDADGNLVQAPYGAWCRDWKGGGGGWGRGGGRGCCGDRVR